MKITYNQVSVVICLCLTVSVIAVIASILRAILDIVFKENSLLPIYGWGITAIVFAVLGLSLWWSNRPKKSTTKWTR